VLLHIHRQQHAHLAKVARTSDGLGRLSRFIQGRKKQSNQYGDDADDDQKLNEGKGLPTHGEIPSKNPRTSSCITNRLHRRTKNRQRTRTILENYSKFAVNNGGKQIGAIAEVIASEPRNERFSCLVFMAGSSLLKTEFRNSR